MKKVYPRDQKERVLRKLLELGDGGDAPEGAITKLANAEGIPLNTLYTWNASLKRTGVVGKFSASGNASVTLSSKAKYEIVIRTESMTELELGTYLREHGILPADLERWKVACQEANDRSSIAAKEYRSNLAAERTKVASLERELARKEKALAETAALLVLRGKAQAFWGDRDD
ncbi:hypothetical protein [Ferrimicrobium acidiphilum]|uniref:Transposase n=1 Tax=Ferrimicrobium acidiphilum TaxID=121039 RepID=A0ABV3Y8Q5_9ACTN